MIAAVLGCTVGGCNSALYVDMKDTVDSSSGEAVAHNLAMHVIDPWPEHARNTNIGGNGVRTQAAVERYCRDQIKTAPQGSFAAGSAPGGGGLAINLGSSAPSGPEANGEGKRQRGCV
ncbi:hypothetical protein [Methylobacterium nodulans]|uniref:Uncharacterized protein n=1 Tax=Methylobacterium nodulans (strain LMG 21967 / CNCM I-2342 / ORS 2060) TaxID=460265 RepID=B8IDY1_METNO|nr:hypothetical protein [Methylobacterium nodulans]ACL57527.1 hypothetical protein Mnod_2563 [Methylobacterium nodulans ORS 2060]